MDTRQSSSSSSTAIARDREQVQQQNNQLVPVSQNSDQVERADSLFLHSPPRYQSRPSSSPRPTRRPWRILSLDGGGVKGLVELRILERLFRIIRDEQGLPNDQDLRPCEYFDLIGGTSTGGLNALLLGRMRMTVPEAIKHFKRISGEVFKGKKPGLLKKMWKGEAGVAFFDGQNLSNEIERVLRELRKPEDLELMEPNNLADPANPDCKVFVTATNKTTNLVLLRSYYNGYSTETNYRCTIEQAARATSAAPLYFAPFVLHTLDGQHTLTLSDGALNLNNPIVELMAEVRRLDPNRDIACIVSVGTGRHDIDPNSQRAHDIIESCVKIGVHCHKKAQEFVNGEGYRYFQQGRYYRFDVDRRMDRVALEDWERLDDMDSYVEEYLKDFMVGEQMKQCAETLLLASRFASLRQGTTLGYFPSNPGLYQESQSTDSHQSFSVNSNSTGAPTPALFNMAGASEVNRLLQFARHSLRQGLAKDAKSHLQTAYALLDQKPGLDQGTPSTRVTLLLMLATCHFQKAGSLGESKESIRRHLTRAEHFIREAGNFENKDAFDQRRIEMYDLFLDLRRLDLSTGMAELDADERASYHGRLLEIKNEFNTFPLENYGSLSEIYQRQIDAKMKKLEPA